MTVKTVFERSKIPLTKWLAALFLMTASKKGVSAHQVHRMLGISYKSTWFMMHRLREAMRTGGLEPLGGKGKVVEADETYFGKAETMHVSKARKGRPYTKHGHFMNNRPILALVERGGDLLVPRCRGRSGDGLPNRPRECGQRKQGSHRRKQALQQTPYGRSAPPSRRASTPLANTFAAMSPPTQLKATFQFSNAVLRGTYQHCSEKHLHRYLAEFDFRHNNRIALGVNHTMRAENLAAGIVGKRLTYRRPYEA